MYPLSAQRRVIDSIIQNIREGKVAGLRILNDSEAGNFAPVHRVPVKPVSKDQLFHSLINGS